VIEVLNFFSPLFFPSFVHFPSFLCVRVLPPFLYKEGCLSYEERTKKGNLPVFARSRKSGSSVVSASSFPSKNRAVTDTGKKKEGRKRARERAESTERREKKEKKASKD
jgi:hypothetical protein